MKNPFSSSHELKVVASPEPVSEDFDKMSIDQLAIREKQFQIGVFRFNRDLLGSENRQLQAEAQRKLVIVQRILREKIAEQENAKKLAQQQYVKDAVQKNLGDIRFCVNPPPTCSSSPWGLGISIENLNWLKTQSTTINFKAPVKSEQNGKTITKVQDYKFNLLDISADKFTEMCNNRFRHQTFRMGNQTLYLMLT